MLLYDLIEKGASQYPQRPALTFKETTLTYGAVAREVNRLACGLQARGIGKGDSVALFLPNYPQFTLVYYAVTALGALCVPANPLLKAAEVEYMWRDAAVRIIVTLPPLLPTVLEARRNLSGVEAVVSLGEPGQLPEGIVSLAELAATGNDSPKRPADLAESDPAVCIYTSGTTGRPKGALLSHRNLLCNCWQISQVLHITAEDTMLCVLPLFHSFAATVCQNTVLYCGCRLLMLDQFHPGRGLDLIESERVTIFPAVPAMFGAMARFNPERTYNLSSLRICVSGGAPMTQPILEAFEKRFSTVIIEGDGPTECSPVTSVNPPEGVRKIGSIGLPLKGVDMKIFDRHDRELPPNEVGEIVVRGDNVMLGYLNQPEATAEAMRSGWYHTGDLGKVDEDGYFYIVDRKKDMLIVGGLNVYPREVEEALLAHPEVADVAVIGEPDALRGEAVVAIVIRRVGSELGERELVQFCRQRLANYKVPRRILFREALPYSTTGKVLKGMLRKELDLGS